MHSFFASIYKNNSFVAQVELQQIEGKTVVNSILAYHYHYRLGDIISTPCTFRGPVKAKWPKDREKLLIACHIGHNANEITVSEDFYKAMKRPPKPHPALAQFASRFELEAYWPCCMNAWIDSVNVILIPASSDILVAGISLYGETWCDDFEEDEGSYVVGPMSLDEVVGMIRFMQEKTRFLRLRAWWDDADGMYKAKIFSVDYEWNHGSLRVVKKILTQLGIGSISEMLPFAYLVLGGNPHN